jgi:osomolarity two-component system sensor histidine kinase SLN1
VSSSQNFLAPTVAAPAFDVDTQPRLVGLSAPFFTSGASPRSVDQIPEPVELGGRNLRILIAEDNKMNQTVVLRMLKMEKIYNMDIAEGKFSPVSTLNYHLSSMNH